MPNFSIVKKVDIDNSFRVSKIMSDFDVKKEHLNKTINGEIIFPKEWNIGLIVGNSGTGKSTIINEIFPDYVNKRFDYTHKSVIDDMPKQATMKEIEKMFYSVGFGSVPSWLKPYKVLSTGEKMRVDLARLLLDDDFCVFDEFTSVVDRNVAHTMCIALRKCLDKYSNKKFIAVTCHKDVEQWLQPNWIFNTDTMKMSFHQAHDLKKNSISENVAETSGQNLDVIII